MNSPGDRILPFGKYSGQTIDQVAATDEGLRYLDWLLGQEWLRDPLGCDLEAYMDDPSIRAELDGLTDG